MQPTACIFRGPLLLRPGASPAVPGAAVSASVDAAGEPVVAPAAALVCSITPLTVWSLAKDTDRNRPLCGQLMLSSPVGKVAEEGGMYTC